MQKNDHMDAEILVIDDQATMRRIIKVVLNKCGYVNIDEAEDGLVAIQMAKIKHYDCIITDWIMPKMMGPDLVGYLRNQAQYADIPILMVSTEGATKSVVAAF